MTADLAVRLRPPASPEAAGWLGGCMCWEDSSAGGGGWSPAAVCGGGSSPLLGHFASDEMGPGVPSNTCPLSPVLRMLWPWSSAKGAQIRSVLEVLKAK